MRIQPCGYRLLAAVDSEEGAFRVCIRLGAALGMALVLAAPGMELVKQCRSSAVQLCAASLSHRGCTMS